VFALHIDTARTWRGGQNQVLLTVLGLRAIGHKAVLVAHPEGELYRRAAEGPDLVPLAPHNEIDLSAAWKLSRIVRDWKPQIVHAHDPHAVAMAGLALSFSAPEPRPKIVASRRVDFHLQGHSFSKWKYRQVDLFVAASQAIRGVLEHDGIPSSRIVVVHDGIDVAKIGRLPTLDLHAELWLPHKAPVIVNVGALVAHKGQKHLVDAMPMVLREMPDAHLVIFGEGELRPALERQVKELRLEKHVLLPGFRADVLQLMKSADLFAMSSVTGVAAGGGRHHRRRHSRGGDQRPDRAARRHCESASDGRRAGPAAEGRGVSDAARQRRSRVCRRQLRGRAAARGHARGVSHGGRQNRARCTRPGAAAIA
jgi:glycosyltransferase involved in cell wall biosynthesis